MNDEVDLTILAVKAREALDGTAEKLELFHEQCTPELVLALLERMTTAEQARDGLGRLIESADRAIGDPAHPSWDGEAQERVSRVLRLFDEEPLVDAVIDGYEAKALERAKLAETELQILLNATD